MKTSPFLICNDPFNDEAAEMILHNERPRFLASVTPIAFDDIEKRPERPFADALYVNSEGVMDVYRIVVDQTFDRSDEEDLLDAAFEASAFFCEYITLMEKEEGLKPGFPVRDFSDELPGLKILHAPDRWTIVYNGLIADFATEEEMDDFLESELSIESELLDKGIINQFD
ncbi:MAG: hypothetical protein LWW85_09200 [Marinilabiliales bacterium]|nr:hypothetical protein [Marinilabiliales bacterium]